MFLHASLIQIPKPVKLLNKNNITTMHNKIEINRGINNKENAISQKITTPRIYIYYEILLKKKQAKTYCKTFQITSFVGRIVCYTMSL